jgi:hypothetical protein
MIFPLVFAGKISSSPDVFPVVEMLICPRFVLIAIQVN